MLHRVVLGGHVLQCALLSPREFVAAPHLVETVEIAIDRDAVRDQILNETALGSHVIEWQTQTTDQGRESRHVHVGRGLIDHIHQLALFVSDGKSLAKNSTYRRNILTSVHEQSYSGVAIVQPRGYHA